MGYSLVPNLLFWAVSILIISYESKGCTEKERFVLLQIKSHLALFSSPPDALDFLPSWSNDTTENCCLWERVGCDPSSGHIVDLSLGSLLETEFECPMSAKRRSLNMTIFQELEELQRLDLSFNCIEDLVEDDALCKLRNLEVLSLTENGLNGGIPNCVGNLSFLTTLDLSVNHFTGNIPSGLCKLARLEWLNLNDNYFKNDLPSCVWNLTSLQVLLLGYNHLSGRLPSGLCKLKKLQNLVLSSNQFTGSIASTLSNLTSLEELTMSDNSFEGKFSLSLLSKHANLTNIDLSNNMLNVETEDSLWMPSFQLESLYLSGCSLNKESKTFPKFLSFQDNLFDLDLSNNGFDGSFPTSSLPSSLLMLFLPGNNFCGKLPESIGSLFPILRRLDLSRNYFEGQVPGSIGEIEGLEELDLSHNKFDGELPKLMNLKWLDGLYLDNNQFNGTMEDSLLTSSNLRILDISNNRVSNKIPSWIGTFKELLLFSVRGNILHGQIPSALCSLSSLMYLDLSNNRFSGQIPSCNGTLLNLQYLHLQNNSLNGYVPFELSISSYLVILDLRDNHLVGSIPSWIGQLSQLSVLQLGNNKLQGGLPRSLCRLHRLNIMDVANNEISGTIPPCLKDLSFGSKLLNTTQSSAMSYLEFITKDRYNYYVSDPSAMSGLDLSCNQLSGHIPPQLGDVKEIRSLNLSHNKLIGLIPKTFSMLGNIESLDLSYNNLSGSIPSELAKLNFLEVFNVSYNNLSGRVPMTGQFGTFDVSSYEGNPFLCGYVQDRSFIGGETPHGTFGEDTREEEKEMDKFDWGLFFWSFGPSCTVFLLGSMLVLYYNPHWLSRCLGFLHVPGFIISFK